MADAGPGSDVILTAKHPLSMRTIARTRRVGTTPVFCFQSGHDPRTPEHPSFRTVLHRGILWAANRCG